MKKRNIQPPKWFLTSKEEQQLSEKDKEKYYEKLREYCLSRKFTNATIGATFIGSRLKKVTNVLAKKVCNILAGGEVNVVTDGIVNIPDGPVIFAASHQGVLDGFVWITDCPKHALVVPSAETSKILLGAQINTGLILVTKKKIGKAG